MYRNGGAPDAASWSLTLRLFLPRGASAAVATGDMPCPRCTVPMRPAVDLVVLIWVFRQTSR